MAAEQPQIVDLRGALRRFAFPSAVTQSSDHIKRLHWYVAMRLVVEAGFDPQFVQPRPPFRVERKSRRLILHHDPSVADGGEKTVLGGLKTKRVDVTVTLPDVGPVVAVSLKGTHNAIRNLTNRMEEAAGDCTNLHMAYPALVYGFWHVIRANEEDDPSPFAHFKVQKDGTYRPPDLTILSGDRPADGIERYAYALKRLSNREDLRDHPARYEACSLTLVRCVGGPTKTSVYPHFPTNDFGLGFDAFFRRLIETYDRRFVYQAPALKSRTERLMWDPDSPAIADTFAGNTAFAEMNLRLADG